MDMALVRRQASRYPDRPRAGWERQKLWLWRLHRYSVGGLSIVHGESCVPPEHSQMHSLHISQRNPLDVLTFYLFQGVCTTVFGYPLR